MRYHFSQPDDEEQCHDAIANILYSCIHPGILGKTSLVLNDSTIVDSQCVQLAPENVRLLTKRVWNGHLLLQCRHVDPLLNEWWYWNWNALVIL